MRFAIEITLKGEPPFLVPVSYRSNIVSLIKEFIKSCEFAQDVYNEYWGNNNTHLAKPYTFFLNIPYARYVQKNFKGYLELDKPEIKLYISSNDPNFLSMLHNGFLKIDKKFMLFGYPIELQEYYIAKSKSISTDYAEFKILSPIIVRDIAVEGFKKNFKGYLSCNNPSFGASLIHSISTLCKHFLITKNKVKPDDIEIDTSGCSFIKINHYHEIIPGTKGIIGIKANNDILELIYNIGLGARRSQGFGMVDLAKSVEYSTPVVQEMLINY